MHPLASLNLNRVQCYTRIQLHSCMVAYWMPVGFDAAAEVGNKLSTTFLAFCSYSLLPAVLISL